VDNQREKQVFQLIATIQWAVISLTFLYTQLPHIEHIERYTYWLLGASAVYALIFSKLPEALYSRPRFFLWLSLIHQFYAVLLVHFTGGIESDLHWLFLLPILFITAYYGMKEGFLTAALSSGLLLWTYLLDPHGLSNVIFWHICLRRLAVLLGTALFGGLFANEEIRERKQIEISHELSQMYMQDPSLQNILASTSKQIEKAFDVELYALMLFDARNKTLIAQKPAKGLALNRMNKQAMPIDLESPIMSVVAKGEVFVSNKSVDTARCQEIDDLIKVSGVRNILIAGLISKNDLIGVLVLANKNGRKGFDKIDASLMKAISGQTAIHLERARLYERTQRNAEEATMLFNISKALSSTINIDILLKLIAENTAEFLGADTSCLMLLDKKVKELSGRATYCSGAKTLVRRHACPLVRLRLGEGVPGWVAKNAQALLISDVKADPRFKSMSKLCRKDIGSALSVPLIVKDSVIGVLNAGSILPHKFNEEDLKTMITLAGEAAVAIHNAQLFSQLEELYLDTLKTLIAAIEVKDRYTRGHSEHVIRYALAIAQELNLTKQEKGVVKAAALLHDIGKIGITEKILLKSGRLTREEREQIRKHPSIGVEILGSIRALREVIPLVLHHHERYDGKGYPSQLRSEEIPVGARILAVADAFDAMISDRPYRKALSFKKALAELSENSGSQFDPKVVKIFVDILKKPDIEEELSRIERQLEAEKVSTKKE